MQIKDHIQVFGAAPDDQPVQQLETLRVVALKQAVMQRNSNGVEPRPVQQRDVLTRDVVLAVLLPECSRPFRSKELQHQRANLPRRLRPALEQPHVTLRHHPIAQICCANKERFTGGIDDLLVLRVRKLRAPLRSPHQKKQQQLQKPELDHGFLPRKSYIKFAAVSALNVRSDSILASGYGIRHCTHPLRFYPAMPSILAGTI